MGLDNGLAPNMRQGIIWTDTDPIHWRIYLTLGGDELINSFCAGTVVCPSKYKSRNKHLNL